MSKKLPASPMVLLPNHLHIGSNEVEIELPIMPSEYPKEPPTVRRTREEAEKESRSLLNVLFGMERRGNIMPGSYNAVIHLLTAVIVGKSPHALTTEFWRLYGRVEGKWNIPDTPRSQRQMEDEMTNRLQATGVSQQDGFRDYTRNGVTRPVPLPLFVRNVLAHQGTNSNNRVTHEDINRALQFLGDWANE